MTGESHGRVPVNPPTSAEKTLRELRVLFYCVAPIPLVGWFLAASAEVEGLIGGGAIATGERGFSPSRRSWPRLPSCC
jgi:hypothetical protein